MNEPLYMAEDMGYEKAYGRLILIKRAHIHTYSEVNQETLAKLHVFKEKLILRGEGSNSPNLNYVNYFG